MTLFVSLCLLITEAFWVELRYTEAQVCSVKNGEIRDWLPGSHSARTRVHEYGLGAIDASADTLFFSNDADRAVYALDRNDSSALPRRLSLPDTKRRFADLEFSPQVALLHVSFEINIIVIQYYRLNIISIYFAAESSLRSDGGPFKESRTL